MIVAKTVLDTESGSYSVGFHRSSADGECVSLALGDLSRYEPGGLPVRMHSSCVFGEAFGACDCDCGAQLRTALAEISRRGRGVVIYLYQEGRGAGLEHKIRGMGVQRATGENSYRAYEMLGLERDQRDYAPAISALADLGASRRLLLMSNNPLKRTSLEEHGYRVVDQLALSYRASKKAYDYLVMKQRDGQHTIDLEKIEFVG